ncbi:uncharacterized protein MONOS_14008 [Monocercomonoides exilis]|uniref:uncharacterized protein n=1 Tax=Monocercomonoides exilis TaxID=2049356 RepID=UPI0035594013|nr:hypothetical protein MONOS_14008 [Monocercomonoides exilis]|eukprot:MONOS_14008.1-p1 / transcript=MONOS_14008.1 / gene=MONOS_14008 / organism=Monocercomonoides_exilis_PA203 / gene_product=unspecified product / transcript_product=unspecified product / location=Mono_scaffold00920:15827-16375(-) / protein_length=153 / sequence_SO=supercontig / SO=protein_coding / is_pseudo=false
MPLSLQLLLSLRELQTLTGYVVTRRVVLYGGVVCAYDVALSEMLSVPLVAQLPSLAASQIWRSPQSRCAVVKLDDEVMRREVAVCEVGGIVEKGLDAEGLRMEDVVLSPAAIALDVLEEREEAEEGKRGGKEGRREESNGNESKGGNPIAHR